jgi:hypothetical protein
MQADDRFIDALSQQRAELHWSVDWRANSYNIQIIDLLGLGSSRACRSTLALHRSHFAISACSVALSATQDAEAALEMPIVTTAKRILTSVRADACRRIAFADSFWWVRRHSVVRRWPHDVAAKYARRQHFYIQPQ